MVHGIGYLCWFSESLGQIKGPISEDLDFKPTSNTCNNDGRVGSYSVHTSNTYNDGRVGCSLGCLGILSNVDLCSELHRLFTSNAELLRMKQ